MREPSETGHDVAVPGPALDAPVHVGPPDRVGLPFQGPQQVESAVLFAAVLGVVEGVVEPDAGHRVQRGVQPALDGVFDDLEGPGVAVIGPDRAAMDVPCELVQQQDESQRAVRCFLPVRELGVAVAGARDQVAETRPDLAVDPGTAPVPPVAAGRGPFRAVQAVGEPEFVDPGTRAGTVASRVSEGVCHGAFHRQSRVPADCHREPRPSMANRRGRPSGMRPRAGSPGLTARAGACSHRSKRRFEHQLAGALEMQLKRRKTGPVLCCRGGRASLPVMVSGPYPFPIVWRHEPHEPAVAGHSGRRVSI